MRIQFSTFAFSVSWSRYVNCGPAERRVTMIDLKTNSMYGAVQYGMFSEFP